MHTAGEDTCVRRQREVEHHQAQQEAACVLPAKACIGGQEVGCHGARWRAVHLLPVHAHVRGQWEVRHQPGRLMQPSSSQQ